MPDSSPPQDSSPRQPSQCLDHDRPLICADGRLRKLPNEQNSRRFALREGYRQPIAGQAYLVEALGAALDSLTVGVIIVAHDACILHANQVARHMLDAGWPLASLGGRLAALQAEVTKELRKAIAVVHDDSERIGAVGIGVPLMHAGRTAAAAHVLPLAQRHLQAQIKPQAIAAVFVVPAGTHLPVEVGTVARVFGLTPAETRLLQQLVAGASLREAAAALGVSEATTRTHRNHIFMKAGVSRRTDLLALIGHLIPPIHCTPSYPLGESTEPTKSPPSRTKRASTERLMWAQGKADSLPKMGA